MQPKKLMLRDDGLFRMQLTNMIDMAHPLVNLAGLHLLKHMAGLSDGAVCKRWVENPYFQYFCGEQYFRHRLVLDRSSMARWRGRIGGDQLELLLAETLSVAMRMRAVTERAMERVTLDSTVQTKAVAHPTDSHLLMRSIQLLNRLAKKHGVAGSTPAAPTIFSMTYETRHYSP